MNHISRKPFGVVVLAMALALFGGCATPTSGPRSLDELTSKERRWISEIKKHINPKQLREWVETAQVGEDGMTIPRATWPAWLAASGGCQPPLTIVKLERAEPLGVYYLLDYGPGLLQSGISVDEIGAPVGPHVGTLLVEWESNLYFFFSRLSPIPRPAIDY